jgi:hypothetical protein
MTGVVSKMISNGRQHTGRPITYTAYARWWQEREMTRLDTRITAGQIEIADADAGGSQALAVELPGRRAQLLPRPGRYQLEGLDWQPEAPVFVRTAGLLAQRRRTWLARFRQKLRDRRRQT